MESWMVFLLRVAVNQKYVPNEVELKDGDEVAFIPPVQGGLND